MTRSLSARVVQARRPRCCWRARAIASCWSTRRRSRATRCPRTWCIHQGWPPLEIYSFDFGPVTITGRPRPIDGIAHAYGPRRTILDQILIDAADEAGVEVREGF